MLGSQEVDKVMLGTAEVWSNNPGKEKLYHATNSTFTKLDAAAMTVVSTAGNTTGYTDVACVRKKLLVGYFGSSGNKQGAYQLDQSTFSVIGAKLPGAMWQYANTGLGGAANYFFGGYDDSADKPAAYDPQTFVRVKKSDYKSYFGVHNPSGQGNYGYLFGDDDYDDGYTRHVLEVYDLSEDTIIRTNISAYEDGLWVQDSRNGASPATETRLFAR